ncbi:CerR family C-terminal domain-containing protein [Maridesulfovibrio frigidus]|uniref:CerR family C-terminal domain-containing protein n=1 Tax=Maridesulfovibrio frigidus TaxID=340956 RepID=UPI0004E0D9B6|nr:CerR family C-terminal domain-containing protein [Maridesulfovibrio frigidus]
MSELNTSGSGNKSRGEETRQKLLLVGARLFAINGFKGVSMRNLAKEANINIATVGYHFGGKLGLYEAVLQDVIDHKHEFFPSKENLDEHIGRFDSGEISKGDLVRWYFGVLINAIIGDPETEWASLIISRELAVPSELYPQLDRDLLTPSFESLALLLETVMEPDASREERIIMVIALMGMALKFAHSKTVLSRVGWEEYTPENIAKATDILCRRIIGFIGCEES